MNRNLFYSWLKTFKKLDKTTSNARTSNCLRIEKYYGDLDDIFEENQCTVLLEELTYTTKDKRLENKQKHKIPIDGNVYNGTSTLKSALRLYIEYKENKLIEKVKTTPDVVADKHDEETPEKTEGSKQYSKEDFLNEVFISEQKYDEICILLKRKKNIIMQGAPGVGKTFAAKRLAYSMMNLVDDSRIEMIQFHQNYSYEDFIMGYRPTINGSFELRYGVFYKFCKKAANDIQNDYFFIIDEINRGNLSKIFGELMLLIEKDKRGRDYAVSLTYMPDVKFYVPKNVHIIGMMNTADRSLAMIDYALRRRFSFIELEPAFSTSMFRSHLIDNGISKETTEIIIERLTYLNNKISEDANLGRGFRIGHSYFCDCVADENWYQSVIQYEIKPLIEEYWFDNEEKANEYVDYLLG